METLWITVYKDTVNNKYNGDNNLLNIKVPLVFAELYFLKYINNIDYRNFNDFINNHTADITENFYKFAKEYDAIIDIEEM